MNVSWKAPSNIALVKYWGKLKGQIPANPSVSFTLTNCYTETSVYFEKLENPSKDFQFDFFFEGNPKPSFHPKIVTFFERIYEYQPFLKDYYLRIDSYNSFPHSSGIASSASAMAALALPPIYYSHPREVVRRRGLLVPVTPLTPKLPNEQSEVLDVRFRTVGDISCTCPVASRASSPLDIIRETAITDISERSATRMDDQTSEAAMEKRKKEGYF